MMKKKYFLYSLIFLYGMVQPIDVFGMQRTANISTDEFTHNNARTTLTNRAKILVDKVCEKYAALTPLKHNLLHVALLYFSGLSMRATQCWYEDKFCTMDSDEHITYFMAALLTIALERTIAYGQRLSQQIVGSVLNVPVEHADFSFKYDDPNSMRMQKSPAWQHRVLIGFSAPITGVALSSAMIALFNTPSTLFQSLRFSMFNNALKNMLEVVPTYHNNRLNSGGIILRAYGLSKHSTNMIAHYAGNALSQIGIATLLYYIFSDTVLS